MINEKPTLPFKIKKIQIHGFTKNQRELSFQKIKTKYESTGWTLMQYEDVGGLKGFSETYAEFHRLSQPTVKQNIFDWYEENKIKLWSSVIGMLTVISFYGCYQAAQTANDQATYKKQQLEIQFQNEKKKKIETATLVAQSLKNLLRNNGVSEALVIDVEANDMGHIVVIVSNTWLARPRYEKKQMKQIIEMSLKSIAPPEGLPFHMTDYLGNRI